MSVEQCIDTALSAGEIDAEEADALKSLYQSFVKHYGDPNTAKAQMVERLMRDAQNRKRQALLADEKRRQLEDFMLSFRDARGQPDPAKALIYLIEHNGQVPMPAGFSSVVGRSQAILGLAHARMEELLNEFRRTWVTGQTRSKARLDNVVRELFGESTGDVQARDLAKAWTETAEELRKRFNDLGGAIGKRDDWGLPQVHNRRALMAAGEATWIDYILPRLDRAKMKDALTGQPFTDDELRNVLSDVYKTITTGGWSDRDPTGVPRGIGKLANAHAESRFLIFKDAQSWIEYQNEFGGGPDSAFSSMMSHIRGMAEDIAAMEILGPNPRAMLTYLQGFVEKQAALKAANQPAVFPEVSEWMGIPFKEGGNWVTTKSPQDYARNMINRAEDMWRIFRHADDVPKSERVAALFGATRNLNVASKLGGASLSAITDAAFQQMARSFAGLPVLPYYRDLLKAFARGPKRDVVRAGIILESALSVLHKEARWAGSMHGPVWSSYLADRVIAASGLGALTQAGRHAFAMSFMATLADHTAKSFDQLPPALAKTLRRYGLTATEWDAMRLDPGGQPLSVDFLRPSEIAERMRVLQRENERVAERFLEMILQETEYATPTGTLRTKAMAYGRLQRGVLRDEMYRSFAQFKMFGLSVALLQTERVMMKAIMDGKWRGAGYAASLLIMTTLYGALAVQLKDMRSGKDPRPMTSDDPAELFKFWGAAMLQGGGLGIYGDFLASETNRMGGGLARTTLGPTGDVAAGLLSITSGTLARKLQGEDTNTGRELVRFLRGNTPGGNLWYIQLAYQRAVLDQLQKEIDPKAHDSFRRQIQRQRRDIGSDFWWLPGDAKPRRAPQMPN